MSLEQMRTALIERGLKRLEAGDFHGAAEDLEAIEIVNEGIAAHQQKKARERQHFRNQEANS